MKCYSVNFARPSILLGFLGEKFREIWKGARAAILKCCRLCGRAACCYVNKEDPTTIIVLLFVRPKDSSEFTVSHSLIGKMIAS